VIDAPDDRRFTQATLDARVDFPTFRNHTFSLEAHAVHTVGDSAPPQRYAYLGGSGTLPTFDLRNSVATGSYFWRAGTRFPSSASGFRSPARR
jgi:hypothetical protein